MKRGKKTEAESTEGDTDTGPGTTAYTSTPEKLLFLFEVYVLKNEHFLTCVSFYKESKKG